MLSQRGGHSVCHWEGSGRPRCPAQCHKIQHGPAVVNVGTETGRQQVTWSMSSMQSVSSGARIKIREHLTLDKPVFKAFPSILSHFFFLGCVELEFPEGALLIHALDPVCLRQSPVPSACPPLSPLISLLTWQAPCILLDCLAITSAVHPGILSAPSKLPSQCFHFPGSAMVFSPVMVLLQVCLLMLLGFCECQHCGPSSVIAPDSTRALEAVQRLFN